MNSKLSFKLEVFEGPLDLLLHLIQKNKVNIYDIPISLITRQYLKYLEEMKIMDLEISSEFIVMAARLLYIKSRLLLPKHEEDEEEEDPRQELILNLAEYKKYKEVAGFFADRKNICDYLYFKKPGNIKDFKLKTNPNMDIDRLSAAFLLVMKRLDDRLPPSKIAFSGIIGHEIVSVKSKIKTVSKTIKIHGQVTFDDLFSDVKSRSEIIAIFLAVLELVRNFEISIDYKDNEILLNKNGD